jgi:hypothetical protein
MEKETCLECPYFSREYENCDLLESISINTLTNLLTAPCGLMERLNKASKKMVYSVKNSIGDKQLIAEELVQEGFLGLVEKFNSKAFSFKNPDRKLDDIINYAITVMKHSLVKMEGTSKKIQGRYCINYLGKCNLNTIIIDNGIGSGKTEAFPHYNSLSCRDINPKLLDPACNYFTPPQLYSLDKHLNTDDSASKTSFLDLLNSPNNPSSEMEQEWKSTIISKWIQAETLPEMRQIIRIIKYWNLLESDQNVSNISKISKSIEVDSSTIHNDLEILNRWRHDMS